MDELICLMVTSLSTHYQHIQSNPNLEKIRKILHQNFLLAQEIVKDKRVAPADQSSLILHVQSSKDTKQFYYFLKRRN